MTRETMAERLAYAAYAGGGRLARALPERVALPVFRVLAGVAHASLPAVRQTVRENQAQVLGLEPDDPLVVSAAREAFDLYGRYWLDSFRAPLLDAEEVDRRVIMEGNEAIDAALEAGTGCIAALPHMGNWDVAGRWVSQHYPRIASVAEELRPKRLTDLFLEHRRSLGMHILPLGRDGNVGRELVALLAANWIVALVADRELSGRGIEVRMFDRMRRMPSGPALLSLSTGAPLLACPVFTTDDGWRCDVRPVAFERTGDRRADVRELTQRLASAFERAVAARPPDWHMFQPGWDA